MKQTIYGMVATMIVVLAVVASLTLYGRERRREEMDAHLTEAVKQTMHMVRDGTLEKKEQMIGSVLASYIGQKDATIKLIVKIPVADEKKGLLQVSMTEQYRYPTGEIGSLTRQKTMILDEWEQEEAEPFCRVRYEITQDDGTQMCYKEYRLQKGDPRPQVRAPKMEGKAFLGWHKKEAAEKICFDMKGVIEQDEVYQAVFSS